MKTRILTALVVSAAIGFGATAAFAQAKKKEEPKAAAQAPPALPDFQLLASETKVEFGGCNPGDPLIKGIVAVKNAGKARAPSLVASAITAAYIPEHLDMKDEDIDPNSLNVNEILTKEIEFGKNLDKSNRGFDKTVDVFIVVDPFNKVKESNEQNNIIKRKVKLNCK